MKHYTIKEDDKNIKCIEFKDIQEQKEYVDKVIKENRWEVIEEIRKRVSEGESFFGNTNLEQTMQGLEYGLNSYTSYFLDNLSESTQNIDETSGLYMDVEGFAYDMGSVVDGVPECCINSGTPLSTPIVKILVDITFNGGTNSKKIMNRGVAITNLVNTLLAKKNIVELSFVDFNTQHDMDTMITTKVDTTTLPISTVAMMCSPQFFRQVSWITTDELRGKDSCWGRGRSMMTKYIRNKIKNENIFFIGGSYTDSGVECGHYDSIGKANEYIATLFNEYTTKEAA